MESRISVQPKKPWFERTGPRIVVGVILFLHLTAVFVAPMDIAAPQRLPESRAQWPLIPWLADLFGPYLEATYLDNGYGFFAPDPPLFSSLIHYEGQRKDGARFEGTFPNLKEEQPRLLYHRYFMLTEQRTWLPAEAEVDLGYAKRLMKNYDAAWVRLDTVSHYIAWPEDVLDGMALDDPRLYESRELLTLLADGTVTRPAPPDESTPPDVAPLPPPPAEEVPPGAVVPGDAP